MEVIDQSKKHIILWIGISALLHILITNIGLISLKITSHVKQPDKKQPIKQQPLQLVAKNTTPYQTIFFDKAMKQSKAKKKSEANHNQNKEKGQTLMNKSEKDDLPIKKEVSKSENKETNNSKSRIKTKPQSKKYQSVQTDKQPIAAQQHQQTETPPKKKKFSLKDLQQGFIKHIQGESDTFIHTSNDTKNNAAGLKLQSYMRQISQIYHTTKESMISHPPQNNLIVRDNMIEIIIERSGKISKYTHIQSSGDTLFDNYHMNIAKGMGTLPPIPKHIEDPLRITLIAQTQPDEINYTSTHMPKLQL